MLVFQIGFFESFEKLLSGVVVFREMVLLLEIIEVLGKLLLAALDSLTDGVVDNGLLVAGLN